MTIDVGYTLTATCSGEKASERGPSSKTESTVEESMFRLSSEFDAALKRQNSLQ